MTSISWRSCLKWRRFSAYRLEHGLVTAARHATLESFDPWSTYEPISNPDRRQPPYLHFQSLATAPKRTLTSRILRFTCEWGVLGLLLHRIVDVEFPLIWQADSGIGYRPAAEEATWELHQSRLRRTADGWVMEGGKPPDAPATSTSRKLFYEPESDSWRSSTRVVLRNMSDSSLEVVPFGTAWTRFFTLPLSTRSALEYDYPSPDSDEFWRIYGEPIADFYDAAVSFNTALADIVHGNAATLNSLIQPATISTSANAQGILTNSVATPSLLNVFALMALEDFSEASHTGFCSTCGMPYASAADTPFCSPFCQSADRKRKPVQRELTGPENTVTAESSSAMAIHRQT